MGSGQTTVCDFFKKWGCKVINADKKAQEVIRQNKSLQNDLKNAFGKDIFEKGRLNREKLAERAFRDVVQTQRLNQLVHPRMVESLVEELEKARASARYPIIAVDAALIYEISMERYFDCVVVVTAPLRARQKRVQERDDISRKQFKERVDKQLPLEEKAKWAHFVVKNNSGLEELENASRKVYDQLLSIRKGGRDKKAG